MIDFPLSVPKARHLLEIADTSYRSTISALIEKAEKIGYIRVRLDLPSRQKTSPENRLFHALVAQLAMYRETSPELMKRYIKVRACAHDYPYDMLEVEECSDYSEVRTSEGLAIMPKKKMRRIVEPKSVADASTVEVAILIETCWMVAAEWAVELKQEP